MIHEAQGKRWIIGTRGSRLALWQSTFVASRLEGGADLKIIKTSGDRFLEAALQTQDGKGFFTKEIEDELLTGTVDLAVHSLKDLPTELPEGLALGAVLKRAPVADLLLVRKDSHAPGRPLPVVEGGKIGATSLRRQALLRRYAPDLVPQMLRGNVPTRLDKLARGDYDAVVIARAGIERLQLDLSFFENYELNPEVWIPAPGQAAMAIELRAGDAATKAAVSVLHDEATARAVDVERRLLARFEGGCHAAFGALLRPRGSGVSVWIGHENAAGVWKGARLEIDDANKAVEVAYAKMARVLESGREEEDWSQPLCRPFTLSF